MTFAKDKERRGKRCKSPLIEEGLRIRKGELSIVTLEKRSLTTN